MQIFVGLGLGKEIRPDRFAMLSVTNLNDGDVPLEATIRFATFAQLPNCLSKWPAFLSRCSAIGGFSWSSRVGFRFATQESVGYQTCFQVREGSNDRNTDRCCRCSTTCTHAACQTERPSHAGLSVRRHQRPPIVSVQPGFHNRGRSKPSVVFSKRNV